jgi:hypothetical protein
MHYRASWLLFAPVVWRGSSGPGWDGVDDLAGDGLVLIAATSVLATDLIQHFGFPEALQMTTDGVIGRLCRR